MKQGIDLKNLDPNVDPREDFYAYACGGWQKNNPLKGEYSRFGRFDVLAEEARDNVRNLIENLQHDPEAKVQGTLAQKIGDLYAMGLDMERRNREGAAPLRPILDRIENYTSDKFAETVAWLSEGITTVFFSYAVGPDPGDSSTNILFVMEAGLGLGDRDYYLESNETNDRIMEAYRVYVKRIMTLAGYSEEDADRICATVLEIETELARHKKTREEKRDPLASYNMRALEQIETDYPNMPWRRIFELSGLEKVTKANVTSPAFISFINDYVPTLSERQIKDFLAFNAVCESTGVLGDDFYDAEFEMYSRVMSGIEEKKPLWKRAMGIPNAMFGEAIGQLYVKKYFPEENKAYMLKLVENLRIALRERIENLTWMSADTKAKAIDKLSALKVKIGYPDKWKDYSEIKIDPQRTYMENVLAASLWFRKDNLSKMGKPVDKDEWHMYPQTVNAYYSPLSNEICFPAGILQPPFFDINADDALNYGAIGVVIGHEMTHGFDDSGRRYDKDGNLVNWWTDEDSERFTKLTEVLVEQFNQVEVAPGVNANGKFTLGENIADQGGLTVALTAYRNHCSESGDCESEIEGFSSMQRFFLSYATVWAQNIRPEEILVLTQTDPHSLARNRVNVTLRNLQTFFDAFNITDGHAMYRPEDKRVIIW